MRLRPDVVWAAVSTSRVAHSNWFWCWQVILLSPHMGLSVGLLKCPHNMVAASPRVCNPRNQGRNCNPFYDLGFSHMLSDTKSSSDSDAVWEETVQRHASQEVRINRER